MSTTCVIASTLIEAVVGRYEYALSNPATISDPLGAIAIPGLIVIILVLVVGLLLAYLIWKLLQAISPAIVRNRVYLDAMNNSRGAGQMEGQLVADPDNPVLEVLIMGALLADISAEVKAGVTYRYWTIRENVTTTRTYWEVWEKIKLTHRDPRTGKVTEREGQVEIKDLAGSACMGLKEDKTKNKVQFQMREAGKVTPSGGWEF